MGDVSKKLMDQFANNLNTMLDKQPEPSADTRGHRDTAAAADERTVERAQPQTSTATSTETSTEPLDRRVHGRFDGRVHGR